MLSIGGSGRGACWRDRPEIGSGQKPPFATIRFIDDHFHLVF
jgi:hypothetical protein